MNRNSRNQRLIAVPKGDGRLIAVPTSPNNAPAQKRRIKTGRLFLLFLAAWLVFSLIAMAFIAN